MSSIRPIIVRPFETVRRWIPVDLVGVAGFVVVAAALLTVVNVRPLPVRAVIGFPLVLFAPGYVTVSALFPRSSGEHAERTLVQQTGGVSTVERAALSFGLSLAVVPLLGLAVAVSPWGFTRWVVVGTVGCFVLIGAAVAGLRRARLPRSERYRIDLLGRISAGRSAVFDTRSSLHTIVNLVLVFSAVLALSTVGYALINPQQGEQYSDIRLVTESDSGDLVAANYPREFTREEGQGLTVQVENHERERTTYEVVVVVERLGESGSDRSVVERQELDRLETTVEDGETWTNQHEIEPELLGEDLRLSYFLYKGSAPAEADARSAYRHAYISIDVEPAGGPT